MQAGNNLGNSHLQVSGAGSTVALALGTKGETRKSTASKLLSCMLWLGTGTAAREGVIRCLEAELWIPFAAPVRTGVIFECVCFGGG